jgi:hypothetical protein
MYFSQLWVDFIRYHLVNFGSIRVIGFQSTLGRFYSITFSQLRVDSSHWILVNFGSILFDNI